MQSEPADDAALLRRIASGDSPALEALYDRYSRLVFSVALAMLGDRPSAEEVTLDVFVRVWRRADTYRPPTVADPAQQSAPKVPRSGSVRTWLIAITRHHAIDILRSRNARGYGRPAGSPRLVALDDLPPIGDPAAPDPQADLELSAQRARVRRALSDLPEDQRQALALAYFQGHSHARIAELLGLPLGTVKTRIRLALSKLKSALEDDAASDTSAES